MDALLTQFAAIEFIDWIGMLSGIIGVALSTRERLSAWPFFIICYSAYIYISLRSRLYAFGAMNTGFVFISVYGWCKWSGIINTNQKNTDTLRISSLPQPFRPYLLGVIATGTLSIGLTLSLLTDGHLPFLDAFAVSNALLAQWMLSRKYLENWLFWIIANSTYIALFVSIQLWTSVILFSIFILLACKGWHDWKQSMTNNPTPKL